VQDEAGHVHQVRAVGTESGTRGRTPLSPSDIHPLVGRELGHTYRVLRILAEGGMSVIFEAERLRAPRRRVAAKLLHQLAASNPVFVERFRQEAEILSDLSHPHVVEMLDSGLTDEGNTFYVMELLAGETLRPRLDRVGRMAPDQALDLALQAGAALHAMHHKKILYRGLCPGGVFLLDEPAALVQVKLLDFNLAARQEDVQAHPRAPEVIGVEGYMSPEQARGEVWSLDSRTDQFLLGLVVYEALAGKHPFEGRDDEARQEQITRGKPRPISAWVADLAGPVRETLDRALARDREQRFPDVQAFVTALAQAIAGAPADTLRGFESACETPPASGPLTEVFTSPPGEQSSAPEEEAASRRTRVMPPSAERIVLPPPGGERGAALLGIQGPRVTRVLPDAPQATAFLPLEQLDPGLASASDCSADLGSSTRLLPDQAVDGVDPGAQTQLLAVQASGTVSHDAQTEILPVQADGALDHGGPTGLLDVDARDEVPVPEWDESIEAVLPRRVTGAFLLASAAVALLLIAGLLLLGSRGDRTEHESHELSGAQDPAPAGRRAPVQNAGRDQGPNRPHQEPVSSAVPAATRESAAPDAGGQAPVQRALPPSLDATVAPPRPAAPASLQVAALSDGEPVLAEVYLDGRRRGQTPLLLRRIGPGRHVVMARGQGHRKAKKTVLLRPGKKVSIILVLEP